MTKRKSTRVPILTYHSIDDSNSVVSTSPRAFKEQMHRLSETGYHSWPLSRLVDAMNQGEPFPEKTLVLTFDDGYKNVYTEAFPVLKRYGFSATVFLVTEYCGKDNDWPGHAPSIERRPLLSWSEIKEMHQGAIEFGAHTSSHPDLTKVPITEAEHEIIESKTRIRDHLGVSVHTFAYPYGKYNSRVKEVVRKHFRAACSVQLGRVKTSCDPYALRRVDMYYLSNPKLLRCLSTTALDCYLGARQTIRGLRDRLS